MRPRKGVIRIILSAAAAFALALAAVCFVVDTIVELSVREEVQITLDAIRKDLSAEFDTLLSCLSACAVREIGDPEKVTRPKLEEVFEWSQVDAIRIVRQGGEVVATIGGGEDLRWMSCDFLKTGFSLEMGANLRRFSKATLGSLLMEQFCNNWPNASDGALICFDKTDGVIVSSDFTEPHLGERADVVIEDFDAVRSAASGTFFKARVYGANCLCQTMDNLGYRFLVAVNVKQLRQYRTLPMLSIGSVMLVLIAAFTMVALRRASLLERLQFYIDGEKQRLREDFEAAHLVQVSALPPPMPKQFSYSVAARMDPAKVVGGDFYDYQTLPNGNFYCLVADVSGKGISAAMFMMRAKSIIKQCLSETRDLSAGMEKANDILSANNDSKLFVTVWLGVLNPWTGRVIYVNAGHNPPIVRRTKEGSASIEWVKCTPSLVMAIMPGVKYPVHELTLAPGDSLFLYTDGVTEAQNMSGGFFGEGRLEKVLADADSDLIGKVRDELDAFQGKAEPADDVTMVALDYQGTPPGMARGFPCNREHGFVESARFVEEELARVCCPPSMMNKFMIAYDEVGSNVINYSGAAYFTVKVALEETPPAITLTITDSGKPFNPLDKSEPDPNLSFEQRVHGGFGIFITRQFMDAVIYSRDGDHNVLTLRKSL